MVVAPGRHQRCLVVDDDPLLRWSLVRFLEARGLEARSVESGKLALALLQEWPVELLITAAHLSGMDELELVKRCQGLHPRPGIVILTEGDGPSLPRDFDELGVLGVIEKPLILDSLAHLLASILKKAGGAAA